MTSIWDFSVAFYARPGVAASCLTLQDRGIEVTTLLAALWAEATLRPVLLPEDFERIEARVGAIQRDVVARLRDARIALKPLATESAVHALRESIKRLELDAERFVLEAIAAILPVPTGQPGLARDNLMAYRASVPLIGDPALKAVLASLQAWRKSQAV